MRGAPLLASTPVPADRSVLERVRQPAITIVNLYDFEGDAALVGGNLARPGAWDALRTRTTGPFALPATSEILRETAYADAQLCARATAISRWLDAEGIGSVASYGVGTGQLELLLREARPERELILSEYADGNIAGLRELMPGADVRHHDLLTDAPIDCELHLMHRIDTELGNADWRTVLERFSSQRILWVAAGLVGPRQVVLQLLDLRRRRGRARAGLMRTRGAFDSLWAGSHRARPIELGDLPSWVLEPRRT